jgi:hypothetical protein
LLSRKTLCLRSMTFGNHRICTHIIVVGFSMTKAMEPKAFGPTQPKQLFLTGFLGTKIFFEIAAD